MLKENMRSLSFDRRKLRFRTVPQSNETEHVRSLFLILHPALWTSGHNTHTDCLKFKLDFANGKNLCFLFFGFFFLLFNNSIRNHFTKTESLKILKITEGYGLVLEDSIPEFEILTSLYVNNPGT